MATPRDRSKTARPPRGDEDVGCAWVEALAASVERGGERVPLEDGLLRDRLAVAAERFTLDEVERATLVVLAVSERSFVVSRRLRALAGGPRLTVELLRELLAAASLDGVVQRLAPGGALRARALVMVDGADERWAASSDPVRLEVGLVPGAPIGGGMPALELIEPDTDHSAVARQGVGAQLVALEVAPGAERAAAAQLANTLGRTVALWRARDASPAQLTRLRRDVDLAGAVLFVVGSPSAELLVPPPPRALAPPLVVCTGRVDAAPGPWILRREKPSAEARPPAPRSEIDHIRMLAQRDAERAMGIVRVDAPPRLSVPGRIVESSVRIAEVPEPRARVEAEPVAVAVAGAGAESVAVAVAVPAAVAVPVAEPVPVPVAAAAEPVVVAIADAIAVPVAAAAPATQVVATLAADGPPLELAAAASADTRARAAIQSPSAAQRIELLRGLAGVKSPAVVAALRHNLKSEHALLREVAEQLMAELFGAAWNRGRAIAPPVQPPHSDDNGRGPGGAT